MDDEHYEIRLCPFLSAGYPTTCKQSKCMMWRDFIAYVETGEANNGIKYLNKTTIYDCALARGGR
jgi:hypothetical protein